MSQTISGSAPYNPPYFFAQAMPGMKADSMDDNVETWACGATAIGFGLVVGRTGAGLMTVAPGTALKVGISLHDHVIASRGGYTQYDAVSVLTRGRVWCQLATDATGVVDGAAVMYETATGKVNVAGTTGFVALTNAIFRSAPASVFDMLGGTAVSIAIVEMHYPLV